MTAIGADTLTNMANAAENKTEGKGKMEKRQYGNKEDKLSIMFWWDNRYECSTRRCNAYVSEAIEKDINYFDVAPSYGDAEDHLGPALEPYRKNVFLACKTGKRAKDEAQQN